MISLGVSVLRSHGRPVRHFVGEFGTDGRVTVSHQTGGIEHRFLERFLTEQSVLEVDNDDGFRLQILAQTEELVIPEMIRDFVALMTNADRSLCAATGDVTDHVPPVQEIDVGSAGKA